MRHLSSVQVHDCIDLLCISRISEQQQFHVMNLKKNDKKGLIHNCRHNFVLLFQFYCHLVNSVNIILPLYITQFGWVNEMKEVGSTIWYNACMLGFIVSISSTVAIVSFTPKHGGGWMTSSIFMVQVYSRYNSPHLDVNLNIT